jgi:hypothetical protein
MRHRLWHSHVTTGAACFRASGRVNTVRGAEGAALLMALLGPSRVWSPCRGRVDRSRTEGRAT